MRIILASQSQFRKHALDVLGLTYETIPSNIDESAITHQDPGIRAKLLSEAKARRIGEEHADAIIIAADLFVVHSNKILEKPKDETHAREMLRSLSGSTFETITGLAVYHGASSKMFSTADICKTRFRTLTDFEIDDYIKRYPVLKCAAGFEGDGMLRFAEHIEGSYNFRTAIPMDKLIRFLRECGLQV